MEPAALEQERQAVVEEQERGYRDQENADATARKARTAARRSGRRQRLAHEQVASTWSDHTHRRQRTSWKVRFQRVREGMSRRALPKLDSFCENESASGSGRAPLKDQ